MKKTMLFLVLLIYSTMSSAVYNDNMTGTVSQIMTYADGDYIYFTLSNQPTSHQACSPQYFVISEDVPYQRRQMLLSRLLAAYTTKDAINIGFDNSGDCVHGYIRVHRIG